ncbi:hypothetical protein FRC02_004263 [Tulasnella sp. 418]|nr:hypothetical protein FRC02_004263 [Tulasnella sp. 418]
MTQPVLECSQRYTISQLGNHVISKPTCPVSSLWSYMSTPKLSPPPALSLKSHSYITAFANLLRNPLKFTSHNL